MIRLIAVLAVFFFSCQLGPFRAEVRWDPQPEKATQPQRRKTLHTKWSDGRELPKQNDSPCIREGTWGDPYDWAGGPG